MRDPFRKLANLTIRPVYPGDWQAYRDYYKGLKDPAHFTGLMEGRDLDAHETYLNLFAETLDRDNYVMFGIWNGPEMIAQTSLFFEEKSDGTMIAVFAGSERADAYEGHHLGDRLYDVRKQYLRDTGFEGKVVLTTSPENITSYKAAVRNGFYNTGKKDEHGNMVLHLDEFVTKDTQQDTVRKKPARVAIETAIDRATAGLDSETAAAMRLLYIVTEPGNNREAGELIEAAMQETGKVPLTVVNALGSYGLTNSDGTLPGNIRFAIRDAVANHYLALKGPLAPRFTPPTLHFG